MATVATKPMTADEFYDWANQPERGSRIFELEQGEIVEMPLPGNRHGTVCGNATGILWSYTRQIGKGRVCGNDAGILFERDPDTVRGPDVALYLEGKTYEQLEVKYSEDMPTLVVEVISSIDRLGRLLKRIDHFLEKGIALAWLIDPEAKTVSIHRLNQNPSVLECDEELAGFAELPGFRCKASDFFLSFS